MDNRRPGRVLLKAVESRESYLHDTAQFYDYQLRDHCLIEAFKTDIGRRTSKLKYMIGFRDPVICIVEKENKCCFKARKTESFSH